MIEAVRTWFRTCPLLRKDTIFGVDKLGADPVGYEIAPLSCNPVVKKYVDGSSIRQFQFAFASREAYGHDVIQNILNSEFYEQFADWIGRNDANEIYPDFGEGKKVRSIEVISSGYALEVTEKTSRYQIQLRITYLQSWRYLKDG